jgi:3-deoxy-D-manno-octulosonate 8-phosphate phosphatase (KDO 8-P phosphatase)
MSDLNYKQRFAALRTFMFDVDGVFTDNRTLLMPGIEPVRTFHTRDVYAVQLAVKEGLRIIVMSGGRSQGVAELFARAGVREVNQGVANKLARFEQLVREGLDPTTTAYMGDDIPDLRVMQQVGFPCCPADAVPEIQATALYVSRRSGGLGCVRDVLEQAMKAQGLWMRDTAHHW